MPDVINFTAPPSWEEEFQEDLDSLIADAVSAWAEKTRDPSLARELLWHTAIAADEPRASAALRSLQLRDRDVADDSVERLFTHIERLIRTHFRLAGRRPPVDMREFLLGTLFASPALLKPDSVK